MRPLRAALVSVAVAVAFAAAPVRARVQEYQIVRLLTFKSSCQIDTLTETSGATGPLHYVATCQNLTFYPDGIDVGCDDRDDDRSCRILTPPRHFDDLERLR